MSRLTREQRRDEARHLVGDEGLSIRETARRLGVSASTVSRDVKGEALVPAAGVGSRPAFAPSNTLAVQHGAGSDALVEPRARELVPHVLEANPHLDPARDGAAIFRYAVNLARVERVYHWLAEQADPIFADLEEGVAHGVYERLDRWERACDAAEDRLAIAPLTRARLGLDTLRAQASLKDFIEGKATNEEAADQ